MRYVTIETSIHIDPDVRRWRPATRWLYLYLFSNDHVHGVTGTGCLPTDLLWKGAGISKRALEVAKKEIGDKVGWYGNWYWVKGRAKHSLYANGNNASPKHLRSAQLRLFEMPEQLKKDFLARYPIEGVSEGYRKGIGPCRPNPNPNPNPIPNRDKDTLVSEKPADARAEVNPEGGILADYWNSLIAKPKVALPLSQKHLTHLRKRLKEPYFLTHWKEAIEKIPKTPFLRGEGPRGWRATFLFLIQNDANVGRIINGEFDGAVPKSGYTRNPEGTDTGEYA
jgi:hypothetical protein